MTQLVREIMCKDPEIVRRGTSVREAAQIMKEHDIGDVLVCDEDGHLCGICTDRDIVVRCLAEGRDPDDTPVIDVCSQQIITLRADAPVDEAIQLMRDKAVRRLPIVDGDAGEPVGVLSIGDLAMDRDPRSVLGRISAAPPNS